MKDLLDAAQMKAADMEIDGVSVSDGEGAGCTLEERDAAKLLPRRPAAANKGTFGRVLLIAGSKGMAGAAFLSACAAYRTGAGLVQSYTAEENRMILQSLLPEAIVAAYEAYNERELKEKLAWATVVCIGPGIGTSEISARILDQVLNQVTVPCIIDADGLNLLAARPDWMKRLAGKQVILTPHMKEWSRLTGKPVAYLKENRRHMAEAFVKEYQITLVQKDARTFIKSPGGQLYVNETGCAAMAKAGSGDVLAGILAGLLSQGMECSQAALLGTYLHGRAGELAAKKFGSYSVLAREIAGEIGAAIEQILEDKKRDGKFE